MDDFKKINEMLEKIGSTHKAYPGGLVQETQAALMEAIPAYIEKVVEEKMKAYHQDGTL